MKSDDSTFGYVSVNALMEFARNHVDRKVDCNDIARFPRSNVRNADEQQSLQEIFGIPFARLRELAEAERKGKIKIGSDWTPCAEGMPEFTNFYNVTVGVGGMLGYYEETRTYRYLKIKGEEPKWVIPDRFDEVVHVLAWQPLPAPYNHDHIVDANKKIEQPYRAGKKEDADDHK